MRGESGVQPNGPVHFAIGGLISRDVQLQPNGAVGLGKKGLLTLHKQTMSFVKIKHLSVGLTEHNFADNSYEKCDS